MIIIYGFTKSSRRTKQATQWLLKHNLPHHMITKKELTIDFLKKMLSVSDNGFDDILISEKRGIKIYTNMSKKTKLTTMQLIETILDNPQLLKEPIIFDDNKLLTGYNSDEIRMFLSRNRKT